MKLTIVNTLIEPNYTYNILFNKYDTVMNLKNIIYNNLPIYIKNKFDYDNLSFQYYDEKENKRIILQKENIPICSYKNFDENKILYLIDSRILISYPISNLIKFIFPLFYILKIYKNLGINRKFCQSIIMIMNTSYFFKKILESFFIIKNKKKNIYLSNLIFYCFIYWFYYSIICGLNIFNIDYNEPNNIRYVFVFIFFISEYYSFVYLFKYYNNIKSDIIFNYIYAPFYFFELITWISFCFFVKTYSMFFFTLIMIYFLIKNSLDFKIEEENKFMIKNPNMKAIIPFII